jgi:hypothetical protein
VPRRLLEPLADALRALFRLQPDELAPLRGG